jgi:hypothetical protein
VSSAVGSFFMGLGRLPANVVFMRFTFSSNRKPLLIHDGNKLPYRAGNNRWNTQCRRSCNGVLNKNTPVYIFPHKTVRFFKNDF